MFLLSTTLTRRPVSADASAYILGVVLQQKKNDLATVKPIPCTSRPLAETEIQYDQIKKKSLATTLAYKCFINYTMEKHIKCKQITKTAAATQHETAGLNSARLLRFRLCLMRFAYSSHLIGKKLYRHLMPSPGPIAIQPQQ